MLSLRKPSKLLGICGDFSLFFFFLPLFELLYLSEYFKNILMESDENMKVIIVPAVKQQEDYRRI